MFDRLKALLSFANFGGVPARPYEALAQAMTSNLEMLDAYGTLLSGVTLAANGSPRKTLLITSTQPGEGKTTVSVSLAIAGLLAGKKVILGDGDLRRPSLHRILALDNHVGLSDLLNGTTDIEKVIQTVDIPGIGAEMKPLEVIVSGSSTPTTLQALGAPKLRTVLQGLAENCDLLLIDSPPALAVNDPALLASAVDGIVLVIGAGNIGEEYARRSKEIMERTGTPILGVVLNLFDEKVHGIASHPYQNTYSRDSK